MKTWKFENKIDSLWLLTHTRFQLWWNICFNSSMGYYNTITSCSCSSRMGDIYQLDVHLPGCKIEKRNVHGITSWFCKTKGRGKCLQVIKKMLCGLNQAPRAWYEMINTYWKNMGSKLMSTITIFTTLIKVERILFLCFMWMIWS